MPFRTPPTIQYEHQFDHNEFARIELSITPETHNLIRNTKLQLEYTVEYSPAQEKKYNQSKCCCGLIDYSN